MLILALLFVRVLLFIAVGPRSTSAFPNAKCHGAAIDIKACRESFVTRNLYLPARSSLRRRAGDSPRAQSPAGPSTEPGRRPLDAEGLTLGGGRHSPPEDSSEDEDLGPELIASPENQRFSYIRYGTWVQFTRRNNIPRGIWADMEEGWIPLPRPVPVYKQEWSPRTRRMERRIQHGRVPWQGAEAYLKGKWRSLATEPHASVYVLPGTPLYQLDLVHERRVHLNPAHAAELLGMEPNRM